MTKTICAAATAPGGAIGIIRVSGSDAITIANSIFSKDIINAQANSVIFGTICSAPDVVIDEVLLTLFRAPHSYTGEDSVEISCHGSAYIMHSILQLLIQHGCTMAEPGEYTQRAFLNGKMDLSQAEAVADLIASQNASQHRVAMSQMRGNISNKLVELREKMLKLTSLLELELDFSDHEELEFADRSELLQVTLQIKDEISRLSSSFAEGNAIKNGIPVAIVGAPNVGKSTLLNALLQDDKAIVSDIAGTTRDTIEDTINIAGILYRFIDTAGIRKTNDTIEKLGIERSEKAVEKAQIIIMMRDPNNDFPQLEIREDQKVIKVTNKSEDFQAINGTGLDWLKDKIIECTNRDTQEDTVLITNSRHHIALETAYQDILRSYDALQAGLSGDLVSEDLRQCLHHLAEITGGEISNTEVLHNIFKHFCIGK
ncbi:MAG: tRNA uridine-5-carboxymethylaminomethyl(34) synthesis GTPase MnmE [Prevotella sp.]|nr:tRNA uridine-5-carboxymethylaminomethyl(34) synthesis GTPase MnmE [Candidatus Prevotella equi]